MVFSSVTLLLYNRRKKMTTITEKKGFTTQDITYIGLFTVLIAICSWISIPTTVPFTLQTLGVFLTIGLLGGKRGTISIIIYIVLGAVGLPLFAGFSGGVGIIMGNTGGYILGFLFTGLIMWAIEKLFGNSYLTLAVSMVIGLIVCYAVGTLWFITVYTQNTGSIGVISVLGLCVFPFIIPDLIKIIVALYLTKRLKKVIKL